MKKFLFSLLIFIIVIADCRPQSGQKFAEIGSLHLENGGTILNCKVGYRTYGKLNGAKDNALLFTTWFSGTTEQLSGIIGGNDKPLDSTKYYIVTVDALGNGVSSSPSNSAVQPDSLFPVFNIRDMVESQHILLTKTLGINHLKAIYGGSMGAMQGMQWIVSYPEFMDKAALYVGTPKASSYDLLFWHERLNAIKLAHKYNMPDSELIRIIAPLELITGRTPEYFIEHLKEEDVQKNLDWFYGLFKNSFDSYNWEYQLKAMVLHDISKPFGSMEKAAASVKADVYIIVSKDDHTVRPEPEIEFAKMINAKLWVIDNNCGHLAPSCEGDKYVKTIREFLGE
jgi:homoserine O-acetyltransferase